jgi:hypothetical protein
LLLVLITAGCGGPAGPVTHVSAKGVVADLPGTDWSSAGVTRKGAVEFETWRNPDNTLIFRVSTMPDEEFNVRLNRQVVETYMNSMYPYASEATPSLLRGRNAFQLFAVQPEPDSFTVTEYAVIYKGRHYFVGAGTTIEKWNADGRDIVEGIINTIQFEEPTDTDE